nr:MAG TPA: tail component [Caudoviricetes sp.]
MIAETEAYKLLVADEKLNQLFNEFRGKEFPGYKQGIFTYDIPEKPTNLKQKELAPFARIYLTHEAPHKYADDEIISMEQRITINFWCKNAKQADQIAKRMDTILESSGFERYTANEKPRYMDDDIGLLMNVRKYRLFDWSDLEEMKGK